jgi:hypothetical protein
LAAARAHRQHGIGAQAGFVVAAIEFGHGAVDGALVEGAEAAEGWRNPLLNVADGPGHPLAEVAAAAVAQFVGLMGAGAGAAGHDRPAAGSTLEHHLGLDGGGATGIEHLPGHHGVDHKVEGVDHVARRLLS